MSRFTIGLFVAGMVAGTSAGALAETPPGQPALLSDSDPTYTVTNQAGAISTVQGSDGSTGIIIDPSYYTNYALGGPDPDNPTAPAQTANAPATPTHYGHNSSNYSYAPSQPAAPPIPPRDPSLRTATYSCAAGTSASTVQEEACQAKTAAVLKNMGCTLTTADKDCKYANNFWTCTSPSSCDSSTNYSGNVCPDGYVSETFDSKKAVKSIGGTLQINGLCVSDANSRLYKAFLKTLAAKKQDALIAARQAKAAAALKVAAATYQCPIDPCYVCGADKPQVVVDGSEEYFPTVADEIAHFKGTNCNLTASSQSPYFPESGYSVQGCRSDASQCKQTSKNTITWRCDSKSATDCENNAAKWFKSNAVQCSMTAGTAPDCVQVLQDYFEGWNCTAHSDNCTLPLYLNDSFHVANQLCPAGSDPIAPLNTGGKIDPICDTAGCSKSKINDAQSLLVCKWRPSTQPAAGAQTNTSFTGSGVGN